MSHIDQQHLPLLSIDGTTLVCRGDWVLRNIGHIRDLLASLKSAIENLTHIDADNILSMDSAGAVVFERMMFAALSFNEDVTIEGVQPKHEELVNLISKKNMDLHKTLPDVRYPNFFAQVGEWAVTKLSILLHVFAFFGEFFFDLLLAVRKPSLVSINSILSQIYETGAKAVPLVGLLSFLIGVVLSYQLGAQLKTYGANIFVVQVTGVAILREFAPLITSIIMAGRTSTAFASTLGAMKVNEELDALKVMGSNVAITLIMPRCIALIISLPLLVVWSSMCAIFGSMVMAKAILDINFIAFITNFASMVQAKQYVLGMLKVPFFAFFIAVIGCYQGMNAKMSAVSVGVQTTRAAVQTIFLIIIVDAVFSIIYSALGV